jgi:hydroxymethylpyrimidine pyrophosphatase-like HAD family hydrolase
MPGLEIVRAYHLVPAGASKVRAVARHMQARGYRARDCIAAGDSREDMDTSEVVGMFWLVANALDRDPELASEAGRLERVRVATGDYGAGVYEAVVTTLAEGS